MCFLTHCWRPARPAVCRNVECGRSPETEFPRSYPAQYWPYHQCTESPKKEHVTWNIHQPMLQNNSGSSGSVLLCPSAGEGKAYPAQMFRHSMKLFFMTVWRLCDHIVQFSWLVSVGNSFRSTHLWPGVPWCNSNRGQNCWAQTCSPMFIQTGCESSANTFVLNRYLLWYKKNKKKTNLPFIETYLSILCVRCWNVSAIQCGIL